MKLSRSVREAASSATALRAGTTSTTCRSRSSLRMAQAVFATICRTLLAVAVNRVYTVSPLADRQCTLAENPLGCNRQ